MTDNVDDIKVVTLELVKASMIDVNGDTNNCALYAQFSSTEGHVVLFPWTLLKQTVLEWIEIEKSGLKRKETNYDS